MSSEVGSHTNTNKARRNEIMTKYIVFFKYNPEDIDAVIKKAIKSIALAEESPEKYAKYLFPPHHTGYSKGFSIIEVSDPEQIKRSMVYWFPELQQQFVPIIDNQEMIKAYKEKHKERPPQIA